MSDAKQDRDGGGRVVVGIDGSPSSLRALEWAARQTELTGGVLEPIVAWEWPTSYGWALGLPDDFSPAADAQKVLEAAVSPMRAAHPGLEINARIVEGHPAPVLVDASNGAALVVVGSRGHGEFAGMLLGSVSEHASTSCHCPVVIYRDGREAEQ
jgi:nucleotide-binding universal stress UspA family protein